jgi:hypothetical protein
VKNHDFTQKKPIFFPILGGRPLDPPLLDHFTKLPKHTYNRPEEADATSLLNSICNFDFVVTIVIVQLTVPFLYSTLNEMKTRFTDLHARTALRLQLVPSIIENIAP